MAASCEISAASLAPSTCPTSATRGAVTAPTWEPSSCRTAPEAAVRLPAAPAPRPGGTLTAGRAAYRGGGRPLFLVLYTRVRGETVRKGFEKRSNREFGRYAEHVMGPKEASRQPVGLRHEHF